jgi:O-succinylbenzoate synthase
MRVERVELLTIDLPLVTPFRTSYGSVDRERKLLLRLLTDEAAGWGECAAMLAPLYTSEYVDGARDVIMGHLLPRLAGLDLSPERVETLLAPVRGHRMAKAAIEMAVFDAWGRARDASFASLIGATRPAVAAGVSIGIPASIAALLESVEGYLAQGYRRVKLKIEPGWDVAPVAAVRERIGADVQLQVDANAAYSPADGERLTALDPFDLLLLEQPLAEDDLLGHAALAGRLRTPICLDESITSAVTADHALRLGACSVVNIKPGRVGGYLEARRIHDLAVSRGVPVWCGGMLETGLGRAANVALAALPGFSLPGDLSASGRYYEADVTAPFELVDGHLVVPTGPGLGVEVDEERLASFMVEREEWRPA